MPYLACVTLASSGASAPPTTGLHRGPKGSRQDDGPDDQRDGAQRWYIAQPLPRFRERPLIEGMFHA